MILTTHLSSTRRRHSLSAMCARDAYINVVGITASTTDRQNTPNGQHAQNTNDFHRDLSPRTDQIFRRLVQYSMCVRRYDILT